MRHLILVKHSLPEMIPAVPARQWKLSDEGRARCKALAKQIAPYSPGIVISSVEPKAAETAQLLAEQIDRPFRTFPGLHEQDRTGVGFLDRARFEAEIRDCFKHPDELILGKETANQARDRFSAALAALEKEFPDQTLAVVAHGTVITLFVEAVSGLEPFSFWKKLDVPSFIVFSLPEHELVATVESVV